MTSAPSPPNVSSTDTNITATDGAGSEATSALAKEPCSAPMDSHAARTWLRAEAAAGRAALVGATLAGLGGSVAILVRAYAFASIIALGGLRHQPLARLVPWLAVLGAAMLLK